MAHFGLFLQKTNEFSQIQYNENHGPIRCIVSYCNFDFYYIMSLKNDAGLSQKRRPAVASQYRFPGSYGDQSPSREKLPRRCIFSDELPTITSNSPGSTMRFRLRS